MHSYVIMNYNSEGSVLMSMVTAIHSKKSTLWVKTKSTIKLLTLAFFLAEAYVYSHF